VHFIPWRYGEYMTKLCFPLRRKAQYSKRTLGKCRFCARAGVRKRSYRSNGRNSSTRRRRVSNGSSGKGI